MYGDDLLGDEIARSWLKTVNQFYLEQHKLIEKYHIADGVPREGGGGEYPLQDGFGWTNGVVRRLIGCTANHNILQPAANFLLAVKLSSSGGDI